MSRSKRRNPDRLLLATLLSLAALPALAQTPAPTQPNTEAECRAYAIQTSNEEYLAQDSSVRRNSPFQTGPGGARDPFTTSQQQQIGIDRSGRERQLFDACMQRLKQRQ